MTNAKSVDDLTADEVERIKAANSAAENYGNFYGQNLSPVQAGILLVFGVMNGLGYTVNLLSLIFYTIPIVLFSIVLVPFNSFCSTSITGRKLRPDHNANHLFIAGWVFSLQRSMFSWDLVLVIFAAMTFRIAATRAGWGAGCSG